MQPAYTIVGMRGTGLLLALLVGTAAGEDAPREFQVRPLGFSVAVPAGWTGDQGAAGLVARDAAQNGFMVTREPLLHDADAFAAAWQAQLAAARIAATVERTKACGREAWRAAWAVGDRQIEVWRVYFPDCEMLYNISFSGAKGFDLKAVVDPTLKSFKCTAPKAELKFQKAAESIANRIGIRLPEGYEKDESLERAVGFREYVKLLKGYEPPHVAGRIKLLGLPVGRFQLPNGKMVNTGEPEETVAVFWEDAQADFEPVAKKPRPREATFEGIKGVTWEIPAVGKDGRPRRWMAFCGKLKQDVTLVIVILDEREVRLHKDYLKQLCSNLEVAK